MESWQRQGECLACGTELDVDEFGDPRDADLCGHCVTAKMTVIDARRRDGGGNAYAPGLNECGRRRELSIQADVELRREAARDAGDERAVELFDSFVRLLES